MVGKGVENVKIKPDFIISSLSGWMSSNTTSRNRQSRQSSRLVKEGRNDGGSRDLIIDFNLRYLWSIQMRFILNMGKYEFVILGSCLIYK